MRSYVELSTCGFFLVLSTFWIVKYLDFDTQIKDAQPALGYYLLST